MSKISTLISWSASIAKRRFAYGETLWISTFHGQGLQCIWLSGE